VTWGVLGGTFTAEIDVTNGASFNLVANSVRLSIRDDTDYTAGFPAVSPFNVSANASPTPLIKTVPVTSTEYLMYSGTTLHGGTVQIPPFARKLSMSRAYAIPPTVTNSNYMLFISDVSGNVVAHISVGDAADLEDYVLPDAAHSIGLAVTGANISSLACIFQLDL
jgi:hypothetical protein